ncbi:hypothetical protein RN001_009180 [Aquatica leii]|uniref:EF-hand domain-containing protein n=1 Tax=Aquatica leii TaxID=1421715 RepID=A0AAN7SFI8_9COLE|nr:hypothetical protein RN001_009180 [Aquatica leii]
MTDDFASNDRKLSQERLRFNNQLRWSMEKQSLSTITEEIKSTSTRSRYPTCSENVSTAPSTPRKMTPFSTPMTPRVKKHSSYVLKFTEAEILLPHEDKCVRTPSVQQTVYNHIKSNTKPLFHTVAPDSIEEPSILVTGFGLRNISSLEDALRIQEQRRAKQIYKPDEHIVEDTITPCQSLETLKSTEIKDSDSSETQTESLYSEKTGQDQLCFLMGLEAEKEVEAETEAEEYEETIDLSSKTDTKGASKKMKKAQKYLRIHRIFDLFQFITAHLLSALPDNPITFITELLDKCMIFRSGLAKPPLLYERKHLECLFNLMDRMRTGFIELKQYNTGMHTVGLCTYNTDPPLSSDKMVSKETFIEEAYDSLSDLLLDFLKPRWLDGYKPAPSPAPRTPQLSIISKTTINANMPFTKTKLILP